MSDTPRTTAATLTVAILEGEPIKMVPVVVSEDMERELTYVTEQRDEALSDLAFSRDLYRLQTKTLDDVREQWDRLAEALKIDPYPDEPISDDLHGGNVYCEISVGEMRKIREALQSLTTNKL
jgi:hypothetical protein